MLNEGKILLWILTIPQIRSGHLHTARSSNSVSQSFRSNLLHARNGQIVRDEVWVKGKAVIVKKRYYSRLPNMHDTFQKIWKWAFQEYVHEFSQKDKLDFHMALGS